MELAMVIGGGCYWTAVGTEASRRQRDVDFVSVDWIVKFFFSPSIRRRPRVVAYIFFFISYK